MSATYAQLIRKLYSINMFNAVKHGLENMNKLNHLLGHPLAEIPIVHVTGTNGKGSVCFKIARALTASGIKTGLFLSPHISSFKERIQVDHKLLSDEDVETILPKIFELCEENKIPATFFEITTALAFAKFRKAGCEAVVLEVGMGGRLDATNVVDPVLSVITTVQFDHMKILGDTIEKIGREKAGIIKPFKPALIGPGCPMDVMKEKADEVRAPLYLPNDILPPEDRNYQFDHPMLYDTELLNIDISTAALKILSEQSHSIFAKLVDYDKIKRERVLWSRPICRFEEYIATPTASIGSQPNGAMIIMDIAHNVDAIKALIKKVSDRYPGKKIRAVLGMSSDKDVPGCVPLVLDLVQQQQDNLYCTQAPLPRALSSFDLRNLIAGHNAPDRIRLTNHANDGSIRECVRKALLDSLYINNPSEPLTFTKFNSFNEAVPSSIDNIVIVFGTVFIMSDARAEIGIVEPRDDQDETSSGKDIYNYKDVVEPQK